MLSDPVPSASTGPQPSLVHGGIRLRRATRSVVGRAAELALVEEAIDGTRRGIAGLCIEGEPGIGKSRLLLAAAEVAAAHGFAVVGASADEEFKGPFLLARSIFGAEALREDASPKALEAINRARDALSGRGGAGLDGLAPDQRSMHVLDQASVALRVLAEERPVALLLDDLQWSDADSLKLLRYVVRTDPSIPVFFMFAIRPEESADVPELVTLLADMDRMGIVRRVRLARFKQPDTIELLRLTLAGPVDAACATTIQAQAEGVPFVIEELARSYRENGLLQQIDGTWRLSPKAGRLLPSSVRTLIQRRAARLPDATKLILADASVIGRSFRAADVCAVRTELGEPECSSAQVAEVLTPAVSAGLLNRGGDNVTDEFSFTHAGVAEFAEGLLSVQRRRSIHAAIVDLLTSGEEPGPTLLPVIARHALEAGDLARSSKFCILAAAAAIAVNAPEEALRVIEQALTAAAGHKERIGLLRARDDALEMLRRPGDRLEGLAELSALAEAAGDTSLEQEIRLRRAAALRTNGQNPRAADLARRVREAAAQSGDGSQELAACLELGQDLLGVALGEGFVMTTLDADLDGAEEAFTRAAALATDLADEAHLAVALRELGVIGTSRLRAWFIDRMRAGEHIGIIQQVADGARLEDILSATEIYPLVVATTQRLQRALEIFERLGNRRSAMSTIIAMAYLSWAPDIHVGVNPALRIEEVRRLSSRLRGMTRESERAAADAQMLYGVLVFCRSKIIPDMAVARGREAFALARAVGDRLLEFLVAGGTALACIEIGDLDEAEQWLGRAGLAASDAPTPARARQLETWRATLCASRGDGDRMRDHFAKALALATREGRLAARAEILALRALLSARLGDEQGDPSLLALAEESAAEVTRRAAELPGRPPWAAQADAARASVAVSRGDLTAAVEFGRAALAARELAMREDPHLEILLPAARAVLAAGDPAEQEALRSELRLVAGMIARRTLDADVRRRWLSAWPGRELVGLSGWSEGAATAAAAGDVPAASSASANEDRLLRALTEGLPDHEIARELGLSDGEVAGALTALYARIGAGSRTDATVYAVTRSVA